MKQLPQIPHIPQMPMLPELPDNIPALAGKTIPSLPLPLPRLP